MSGPTKMPDGRPRRRAAAGRRTARTPRVRARRVRSYGSFPTTADVGIWGRGRTDAEVVESLALALFALMTDLATVRPRERIEIEVAAPDPERLVAAFLGQLLVLKDADGFMLRSLRVRLDGEPPRTAHAVLRGEPFDPERHPRHKDVKAITLHTLLFDRERHRGRVIVDI